MLKAWSFFLSVSFVFVIVAAKQRLNLLAYVYFAWAVKGGSSLSIILGDFQLSLEYAAADRMAQSDYRVSDQAS